MKRKFVLRLFKEIHSFTKQDLFALGSVSKYYKKDTFRRVITNGNICVVKK